MNATSNEQNILLARLEIVCETTEYGKRSGLENGVYNRLVVVETDTGFG